MALGIIEQYTKMHKKPSIVEVTHNSTECVASTLGNDN